MLGSIGVQELVIIFAVAMLIFGPSQIPKMGRALGETVKEFRNVKKELTEVGDQIESEVSDVVREVKR